MAEALWQMLVHTASDPNAWGMFFVFLAMAVLVWNTLAEKRSETYERKAK